MLGMRDRSQDPRPVPTIPPPTRLADIVLAAWGGDEPELGRHLVALTDEQWDGLSHAMHRVIRSMINQRAKRAAPVAGAVVPDITGVEYTKTGPPRAIVGGSVIE